jgi:probable H4MPT-linked C1 transfer pathway protein
MIGIDIGGANIKIVDDRGTHIHYCPLWKGGSLRQILSEYRGDQAAVVMTGELADCFSSKWEGINFIVNTIKEIFSNALFYGTDARFHDEATPQLAAANWLAAADYLLPQYSGSLLVDIGSTTTDIIPLNRLDDLNGLTDIERLQKGFLIYNGLLRTNVATFVRTVTIK